MSFPWHIVWKSCVQLKIGFFTWEVAWEKVLTLDHLQGGVLWPTDANFYWRSHLWTIYFYFVQRRQFCGTSLLFGTTWMIFGTVKDTVLCWSSFLLGKKRRFGKLDLLACFGPFGRLGMGLILGMRTFPCTNLMLFFCKSSFS